MFGRHLGERAAEEPPTGVKECSFGCGYVKAHGVDQRDHGLAADNEAKGMGDAVDIRLGELILQRGDGDADLLVASALPCRDPLAVWGVGLAEPLLLRGQGEPTVGHLVLEDEELDESDERLQASLRVAPGGLATSSKRPTRSRSVSSSLYRSSNTTMW